MANFTIYTYVSRESKERGAIHEEINAESSKEALELANEEVRSGYWVEIFRDGEFDCSLDPEEEEED